MINYLVIGVCLILLIAVVYIAAKPISMGIEARRDLKNLENEDAKKNNEISQINDDTINNSNLTDEIIKLNNLKNEGAITEDEFIKAKEKLLS